MTAGKAQIDRREDAALQRDLRTLVRFIEVYCHGRHDAERTPVALKSHDVTRIAGRETALCPDCTRLLSHALVKRSVCPMDPKPQCKHCPNHCYHPKYRQQIREVMKYSGRKLVLRGRVDYLLHLLF
ncbi:MAG: nitrous oxide-stimulated promoter family protein [Phycisphaeraceae bacterium]